MAPAAHRLANLAIVAIALLVVAGCASQKQAKRADGTVVRVTERDFHISAPRRASSGDLRLLVHNRGPDAHELIIVRADGSLPLRTDDLTVDEEGVERATVAALEPGSPGSVRQLRVHLPPGRYELFCNMSGHYLGGMHTRLVVQ